MAAPCEHPESLLDRSRQHHDLVDAAKQAALLGARRRAARLDVVCRDFRGRHRRILLPAAVLAAPRRTARLAGSRRGSATLPTPRPGWPSPLNNRTTVPGARRLLAPGRDADGSAGGQDAAFILGAAPEHRHGRPKRLSAPPWPRSTGSPRSPAARPTAGS